MAIWLPHELLATLWDYGIPDALRSTEGMDPLTKEHWAHCCAEAGVDDLIGLGIWGDGCPCNWDRTRSLEVLSMNLPGTTGEFKNLFVLRLFKQACRYVGGLLLASIGRS